MAAIKWRTAMDLFAACVLLILGNCTLASARASWLMPPTSVTAKGDWSSNAPIIRVSWTSAASAGFYRVYRDNRALLTTQSTSIVDTKVNAGETHTYYVKSGYLFFESAASNSATATAPTTQTTPLPAAPSGLTATPQWTSSCALCNGMAMPHIILTWNSVAGATSYTLYRNGQKLVSNTETTYTDMGVVSGVSYSYTVSAVSSVGEGAKSAVAKATAPMPPAMARLTAPTNLGVFGLWAVTPTDHLTWSPVPGAANYNVYQYDVLIGKNIASTSYDVPFAVWCGGLSYTVTAVDAMGMESLPSGPQTALGAFDPDHVPNWVPTTPPNIPTKLIAVPEWNNGLPRVRLVWVGNMASQVYAIYRDGQKVADGQWELAYFDNAVKVGETHTYKVSGINGWSPNRLESAASSAVSVTVPASPTITAASVGTVQITDVTPNDDSVLVSFAPVPGAVDYRVYSVAKPGTMKYSGGGLSIEMNGLTLATGADLIVEAVDKLGPFQRMDGMAGPGAMQMDGTMSVSTNGQGDPSNLPNVMARSSSFHVDCAPRSLSGAQSFFDTFRNAQALVQSATIDPALAAANGGDPNTASNRYIREYTNDKWIIRDYWGDMDNTQLFFMGNHFMDTLYDGGTPRTNVGPHNNNASLVMMPRATTDISGGKVLHVTFEVDAHFDGRRWCDVFVGAANDTLLHPAPQKLSTGQYPTTSGNLFVWELTEGSHTAEEIIQGARQPLINATYNVDPVIGASELFSPIARNGWDGSGVILNGSPQDFDKRHRFDLYLSQTHFRILENGVLRKDRDLVTPLPFSACQVYFTHELYHTGNDRPEIVEQKPWEMYWYNYRPWADERHWDNMGQEVLSRFP